jgi:hypothetical protein
MHPFVPEGMPRDSQVVLPEQSALLRQVGTQTLSDPFELA